MQCLLSGSFINSHSLRKDEFEIRTEGSILSDEELEIEKSKLRDAILDKMNQVINQLRCVPRDMKLALNYKSGNPAENLLMIACSTIWDFEVNKAIEIHGRYMKFKAEREAKSEYVVVASILSPHTSIIYSDAEDLQQNVQAFAPPRLAGNDRATL